MYVTAGAQGSLRTLSSTRTAGQQRQGDKCTLQPAEGLGPRPPTSTPYAWRATHAAPPGPLLLDTDRPDGRPHDLLTSQYSRRSPGELRFALADLQPPPQEAGGYP